MKNFRLLCIGTMLMAMHMTVLPFSIINTLRWMKNRLTTKPITRDIVSDELVSLVPEVEKIVEHTTRMVVFENNIPDFFEALSGDPDYTDVPSLIDQTIIVNGKAIMPGTSATIAIVDNQCVVTLKLHKGIARLIYAMQHGVLKGLLMRILKIIDPAIQWQYNFTCNVPNDLDRVQLSDIVLAAYCQAQDLSAVNHRFKYVLVVELSLNKELDF